MFIYIQFIRSNDKFNQILDVTDEEQNNREIYYEKTISDWIICYHFKYLDTKQLKHKDEYIHFVCIIKVLCQSSIILIFYSFHRILIIQIIELIIPFIYLVITFL